MGFNSVYRSLVEIFPQVDARILRAVAIEHPKDADVAVGVVLSEIVPCLPQNLVLTGTRSPNKFSRSISDGEAEHEMENGELRRRRACVVSGSKSGASSSGNVSLVAEHGNDTSTASPLRIESVSHLNKASNVPLSGGSDAFHQYAENEEPLSLRESPKRDEFVRGKTILAVNGWQGFGDRLADKFDKVDNGTCNRAESRSSASLENAAHQVVDLNSGEHATGTEAEFGSASSNHVSETLKGSVTSEKGDAEVDGAFSTIVTRSTQVCSVDLLDEIIEDAKSNKKTLFTVMESVMNLMREVELQEKAAEEAKEEAARGGWDTLKKVEELKEMLDHAKEANDMHAGEVYGEKSILATEVKELENRLLNLSEERDKSLGILDEMREMLEARLAAAQEMKKGAEQEKQEKEDYAKWALAEQEAIMEKVVQESKLLQQEAEENSKLRDFLMDRGRIVDSLQGEISVICQDVRLLKERFDERVPLSKSISSSQTSCRLASSGSSSKSLASDKFAELTHDMPTVSNNSKSPAASVSEERDDGKELLEDGWDIFDKETELLRRVKKI